VARSRVTAPPGGPTQGGASLRPGGLLVTTTLLLALLAPPASGALGALLLEPGTGGAARVSAAGRDAGEQGALAGASPRLDVPAAPAPAPGDLREGPAPALRGSAPPPEAGGAPRGGSLLPPALASRLWRLHFALAHAAEACRVAALLPQPAGHPCDRPGIRTCPSHGPPARA
jgi:hypothetical protein